MKKVSELLEETSLNIKGKYYYDIGKTGIGFHGGSERKKAIGFRFGSGRPLVLRRFHRFEPVGQECRIDLKDGDLYIMSEKATGFDWKKSSKLTLRHAAGCPKYTKVKKKKKKKE